MMVGCQHGQTQNPRTLAANRDDRRWRHPNTQRRGEGGRREGGNIRLGLGAANYQRRAQEAARVMSDEPDNVVLVLLRRMDVKLDRVHDDLQDIKRRMTAVEEAV